MIAKVLNGRIIPCFTKEELRKKKEDDIMTNSKDILLESLRVNLDKVRKEKMALESKESEIKNQIDNLVQGE